uniref:Uncharacterized protein n=1 Tax=Arundo donax TaxID=35708 RepID=A0A0A9GYM4_ARUDO
MPALLTCRFFPPDLSPEDPHDNAHCCPQNTSRSELPANKAMQ